jgi:hypothetical protein
MAVASTAVNLMQYAIMSNDPAVQAITMSLIDNGSVMARDIPFATKKSLVTNGVRWQNNLPSVHWSALNAEGTTTVGTPTPFQENAYIIRDYIDVDKWLVEDENQIQEPREAQVQAYLKGQAYDFNYKFINNNHNTGDANSIVGIRYRLDNVAAFGIPTANKIDAAGLDLRRSTLTTASTKDGGNTLLEFMDQLLWSVDSPEGDGVVLYMNEIMKRRLATALRALGTDGGYQITTDQYGRTISQFRNATIVDIGYKADQTTRIIAGDGTAASGTVGELATGVDGTGSSANFTSMYAVNYSPGHFMGWQFDTINVQDLGLINNGVIYRTLIDWAGGLFPQHTRCMARLYDIRIA